MSPLESTRPSLKSLPGFAVLICLDLIVFAQWIYTDTNKATLENQRFTMKKFITYFKYATTKYPYPKPFYSH